MDEQTINVVLCAPEKEKTELEAQEVLCPGEDGIFTVRYGHTPYLTTLIPGVVLVKDTKGEEHYFAASGGFAEVHPEKTLILADSYEAGDNVDEERAKAARERAELRLSKPEPETDLGRAELALYRAVARINAASKTGH